MSIFTKDSRHEKTLGLIVGNRAFFPSHLALSGRETILRVLEEEGIRVIALGTEDTEHGSVVTLEDAHKCAELFQQHRAEIDDIRRPHPLRRLHATQRQEVGDEPAVVFVQEGQRRIPIQYAKRMVGRRMTERLSRTRLSGRRRRGCADGVLIAVITVPS